MVFPCTLAMNVLPIFTLAIPYSWLNGLLEGGLNLTLAPAHKHTHTHLHMHIHSHTYTCIYTCIHSPDNLCGVLRNNLTWSWAAVFQTREVLLGHKTITWLHNHLRLVNKVSPKRSYCLWSTGRKEKVKIWNQPPLSPTGYEYCINHKTHKWSRQLGSIKLT